MVNKIAYLVALALLFISQSVFSQNLSRNGGSNFGIYASAIWIDDCINPGDGKFYNTSGSGASLINQDGSVFTGTNFGIHVQNSNTLVLRGAEVKTFKDATSNVCSARLNYRVYEQSTAPGSFTVMDLSFFSDCNTGISEFFVGGGPCQANDQKWQRVVAEGTTVPYSPINLTTYPPGNYIVEVYYDITGDFSANNECDDTQFLSNGGSNYTANFTIQAQPILTGTDPTICNGSNGFITISGLASNATYSISCDYNSTPVPASDYLSNTSGEVVIPNLSIGVYTNFNITINGCTTISPATVFLNNPVFTPTFDTVNPICYGGNLNALPTTSLNGYSGTWSPSLDNTQTATYTFTPDANQCAAQVTLTITVFPELQNTTSSIPNSLCNSIVNPACNGTATVTMQNTGNYTYLWNDNFAQTTATAFGLCAGDYCVTVTNTDTNCVTTTCVTVLDAIPTVTPTFSFGTNITLCQGDVSIQVLLPNVSQEGIIGSWNPSTIDYSLLGATVYTFTPDANQCALNTIYTVTTIANETPIFSFGQSLNVCSGGTVPTLPLVSDNGITGTWSPNVVSATISDTYTFTPDANQCATTTSFSVTVNPNVTPIFTFGPTLGICSGGGVPTLPLVSFNGITGTWSPNVVSATISDTYIFTPDANQCALTVSFIVTVIENTIPTFSFGTSLNICSGSSVPILPSQSDNGIFGFWTPSVVSATNSDTYIFSSLTNLCASNTSFTVTVAPSVTPIFTQVSPICNGDLIANLPTTSTNSITGTWTPALNNTETTTYTFTPDANQCATSTSMVIEVKSLPEFTITEGCIDLDYVVNVVSNQSNLTYSWLDSSNQLIGTAASQIIDQEGDYKVIVTLDGCSSELTFELNNVYCDIPKGISPNGDGLNDTFDLSNLSTKSVQIFNRYGIEVYQESNYTNQWNGLSKNGERLPDGTYYYVVKFENGKSRTGWVYLIREY